MRDCVPRGIPRFARRRDVYVLAIQPVFLDVFEFARRVDDRSRERRLVAEDGVGLGRERQQGVLSCGLGAVIVKRSGGRVLPHPFQEMTRRPVVRDEQADFIAHALSLRGM